MTGNQYYSDSTDDILSVSSFTCPKIGMAHTDKDIYSKISYCIMVLIAKNLVDLIRIYKTIQKIGIFEKMVGLTIQPTKFSKILVVYEANQV